MRTTTVTNAVGTYRLTGYRVDGFATYDIDYRDGDAWRPLLTGAGWASAYLSVNMRSLHTFAGYDCTGDLLRSLLDGPAAPVRRPRLTTHQRSVYDQLVHYSNRNARSGGPGWVRADTIGCRGALEKLHNKGWADRFESSGPRGGVRYSYRPIGMA